MQQAHMQPQNEPQAETKKNCLTDLTLPKLTDYIKSIGQPAFRAKQIFKWIHQKQATDFSAMTDQPKALLAQFAQTPPGCAHHPAAASSPKTVRSNICFSLRTATALKRF